MYALLMTLFIIVTIFLAMFILIQQGKGDLGLSALGGGTQMLFGGSGGKTFFEKVTWVLGAVFILGSLGLTIMKSNITRSSRLAGYERRKNVDQDRNIAKENRDLQEEQGATSEASAQ